MSQLAQASPVGIAIEFDGLGHRYAGDRWVFRGYEGAVGEGSIFAILGPNGRGKSTLLKILLGALSPTEGTVKVLRRIGYVPQLFQASFPYTVLDMVLMGRARQIGLFSMPSRADEKAAMEALQRVGIAGLASQPFDQLSGGQRQLAIFARAIAGEVDVLLLDEPMSALDLKNQSAVLSHMRRLSREQRMTVVFTTHQHQHAQAVADAALLMLGTDAYALGAAHDVLTSTNLETLYQVPMRNAVFDLDGRAATTVVPVLHPFVDGIGELRAAR